MIAELPIEISLAIFQRLYDADLAILAFMPEFRNVAAFLLQNRNLATVDGGMVSISVDAMACARENQLQWMEDYAEFEIAQQIMVLLTWDPPIYMDKLTDKGTCIKEEYADDMSLMIPYFVNNLSKLPDCKYTHDDGFAEDLFKYIGKNWEKVKPAIHADIGELLEIALTNLFLFINSKSAIYISIEFYKCETGGKLYRELFQDIKEYESTTIRFIYYAVKNNLISEKPVYKILNSGCENIRKYVREIEGSRLVLSHLIFEDFDCESQKDIEWWLTLVPYVFDDDCDVSDSDSDGYGVSDCYAYCYPRTNFLISSKNKVADYAYKYVKDVEILNKVTRYMYASDWLSYAIQNDNLEAFRILVRNCINYNRHTMRVILNNPSLMEIFREEVAG